MGGGGGGEAELLAQMVAQKLAGLRGVRDEKVEQPLKKKRGDDGDGAEDEEKAASRRILKVDKVWPSQEDSRKEAEKLRKDRTKDLKMKITVTTDDDKDAGENVKAVRKPV